MEKGTFRSDLYYRINVIPIRIPPLRERREDVIELSRYFMKLYAGKYNKQLKMNGETLEFIANYDWRGNVRELENYIERLVVTNESEWLLSKERTGKEAKADEEEKLVSTMEDLERKMVLEAWEKYRSSYKVAKELGISQSTAYRRIKKYLNLSQKE